MFIIKKKSIGPVYTRDKNGEKIPGYTRVRRLSRFPVLHLSKKKKWKTWSLG